MKRNILLITIILSLVIIPMTMAITYECGRDITRGTPCTTNCLCLNEIVDSGFTIEDQWYAAVCSGSGTDFTCDWFSPYPPSGGGGGSCTNDCSPSGEIGCNVMGTHRWVCGENDADSCLDFIYTSCPYGCTAGVCNAAPCTNDCTDGSIGCTIVGGNRWTCGEAGDGDLCNERLVTNCPYGCTAGVCNACTHSQPANTCGTDNCGTAYDNCDPGYYCDPFDDTCKEITIPNVCSDADDNVYGDGDMLGECLICRCDMAACEWEPQDGMVDCHTCYIEYKSGKPADSFKQDPSACTAVPGCTDRTCLEEENANYYCGRTDTCETAGLLGVCTCGSMTGVDKRTGVFEDACENACYNPDDGKIYSDTSCFNYNDDIDGAPSNYYCDGSVGVSGPGNPSNLKDRDEDRIYCAAGSLNCNPTYWGATGERIADIPLSDYAAFHADDPTDIQCCGDDGDEFPSVTYYSEQLTDRFIEGAACCRGGDYCFGALETDTLAGQTDINNWACHYRGTDGTATEICQWYSTYPDRIFFDADCDGDLPSNDTDCSAFVHGYVFKEDRDTRVRTIVDGATVVIEGTGESTLTDNTGYYEFPTVLATDPDGDATRFIASYALLVPDVYTVFVDFAEDLEHNFTLYDRDCETDCSNAGICDRTCEGEGPIGNECHFEFVDLDGDGTLETNASDITDPVGMVGFNAEGLEIFIGFNGDDCEYLSACDGTLRTRACPRIEPSVDADDLGILQIMAQKSSDKSLRKFNIATW